MVDLDWADILAQEILSWHGIDGPLLSMDIATHLRVTRRDALEEAALIMDGHNKPHASELIRALIDEKEPDHG